MPATLKCDTITNASNAGTANLSLDASGNATVGNTLAMGSSFLRNRIINGDMRIDQRNAGAAISAATLANFGYTVDRFGFFASQSAKFSFQQNAGSVTPPAGYTNYAGLTVSSAYSVTASDYFWYFTKIEGLNVSDLAWGTANAKTITLSFWVYSSLTGTFGGALQNNAQTWSYPFSYSISQANTWAQISVTIVGPNASQGSGTWLTTNSTGIILIFGLGAGSTYSGTAGAWANANYSSATGAVSVVGTNGATFYVTGVQLEVGSIATPFERRLYGQELMLCQRYYQNTYYNSSGVYINATQIVICCRHIVTMRTQPTVSVISGTTITIDNWGIGSTTLTPGYDQTTNVGFRIYGTPASSSTAARSVMLLDNNTQASAEL